MRLHRAPKVVSGNLTVLKPMKESAVIIPTRGRSPECSTGRGAFSRTEPRGITRFGGRFPARAIIENLGFTGGNNVGIDYALHRRAPADYLFLLNFVIAEVGVLHQRFKGSYSFARFIAAMDQAGFEVCDLLGIGRAASSHVVDGDLVFQRRGNSP